MKIFKKLGLLTLTAFLVLPIGCAGKSTVSTLTGTCNFIAAYQPQVVAAWDKIRAEYPKYEAIVVGKTNAPMSIVIQARAWIAAADTALPVLGAVINNACRAVNTADVQKALSVANETLPKTVIAAEKMNMIKVNK